MKRLFKVNYRVASTFYSIIKHEIKHLSVLISLFWNFLHDFWFYSKYSLTFNTNSEDKSQAKIILLMHALEKGLSFKQKKDGWGGVKALQLSKYIVRHIQKYGKNRIVDISLSVLMAYLQDPKSSKSPKYRVNVEKLIEKYQDTIDTSLGGTKIVSKPNFSIKYEEILEFFRSRNSVREYSSEPITKEEIERAYLIAKTTPTVCNRQSIKYYVIKETSAKSLIIENQLGDQGWCYNADTIFLITANQSYFGGVYERNQAFIDGGLYSMNLAMGLHAQGIATCFKMYIRERKKDKELKQCLNIGREEVPIVLLFAGHFMESKVFSPRSLKF